MSQDYHITHGLEHYTCMVDILVRAGCLNEAYEFIAKMPLELDAIMWRALLSSCRIHGNIDLGEHVLERLISLDPKDVVNYVSLSKLLELKKPQDAAGLKSRMRFIILLLGIQDTHK